MLWYQRKKHFFIIFFFFFFFFFFFLYTVHRLSAGALACERRSLRLQYTHRQNKTGTTRTRVGIGRVLCSQVQQAWQCGVPPPWDVSLGRTALYFLSKCWNRNQQMPTFNHPLPLPKKPLTSSPM